MPSALRFRQPPSRSAPGPLSARLAGDAGAARATHLVGSHDLAADIPLLRFVPVLAQRVGGIVLSVRSELVRLARTLDRGIGVQPARPGAQPPGGVPLQALPVLLQVFAAPGELDAYPFLACPGDAPEVGLAVRRMAMGRPAAGLFPGADAPREPGLERLRALPGICWIGRGEIGTQGLELCWDDMLDRAALLECLDLVITSDAVSAQLASGLGKEVWWAGAPPAGGADPSWKAFPPPGPDGAPLLERAVRGWYNAYYDRLLAAAPAWRQP